MPLVATLPVGREAWRQEREMGPAKKEKKEERGERRERSRRGKKEEAKPAFVIQKDKHFTAQLDCVKHTCVLIVCLQAFKTSVYLSQ